MVINVRIVGALTYLVILVREMQRVMKLQPKVTWTEISAKLAAEFEDLYTDKRTAN